MGNLAGALSAAQRSLSTFSRGLSVTQQNIANASTPGYARQRVELSTAVLPGSRVGQGAEISAVRSLRSSLLEFQAQAALQQEAQFGRTQEFLAAVEPTFQLSGTGSPAAGVDRFFQAVGSLSVNSGDLSARKEVLSAADSAVRNFRSAADGLSDHSATLQGEARATVRQINSLLEQVAELESKRGANDPLAPNTGVETRSQQALDELSELVGFTLQRQRDGTLSVIAGSSPVVTGDRVRPLSVSVTDAGIRVLNSNGQDITETLEAQGGKLGAVLDAHNRILPGLQSDLNRLAKGFADDVNEQLAAGVDQAGQPGRDLFEYATSYVSGAGRTAGVSGAVTPAPSASVTVDFTGGVTGSITAVVDSFHVGAVADVPVGGETITLRFQSSDGAVDRTLTTAPLLGGESTDDIATRINDRIALDPELSGLVTASASGGAVKLVLSEEAGQGFSFTASTSDPGFTNGLESGGTLGGQSARELADALNAQIALNPDLADAGIRFTSAAGELRLDGDVAFDFSATDSDPAATGFASGLDGLSETAGGANAAGTLRLADLTPSQLAAGGPNEPGGGSNAVALAALADEGLVGGLTYTDFYAGVVTDLGAEAQANQSQLTTQQSITLVAQGARDSFSGVDVNEEAVQLLQFERGYSAMLRVIQVLDDLSSEALTLVR